MKINVLSQAMAIRIAAGEVVERPASVVKELIENSVDAGASEISVWVEKSGVSLIRVADNGEGMEADDLGRSVDRHSTSKIVTEEDLFCIPTLGFRGEALPSIASVSKMQIISRPLSAKFGHVLRVEGGHKQEPCPTAASVGTVVEVRELFFNTPARRKFLKSPATELSHICDVVNRTALAQPAIHLSLVHDNRTVADYTAVDDDQDRVFQVLGGDIAKALVPVSWRQGQICVSGYASVAPNSYPNTRYLLTFVNRRYVRDKVLTHAILQGYETLLMKGQYPAAILHLSVPFTDVDVNVHPAKYEVRFRRQSDVHQAIAEAISSTLKRKAKEPLSRQYSGQPPGRIMEPSLPYAAAGQAAFLRSETHSTPPEPASERRGLFSSLVILGQVLGCYLVAVSSDGLVLVDQHAAHERVAFEKLRRQMAGGVVDKQALLIHQAVELSAGEISLLEQRLVDLERAGFVLEPFGPDTYAITAIPAVLPEGDYRSIIREMISELVEIDRSDKLRQHVEERLATIACHSVIRANRKLDLEEMRALLRELDHIDFATQCPHGRPVIIEFSRDELGRMFKRIV